MRLNPSWSPDGRNVAVGFGRHAVVLDRASGESTPVGPSDTYVDDPAFSPDGEHFCYSRYDADARRWGIVVDDQLVVDHGRLPQWNPNGRKLAYMGFSDPLNTRLGVLELESEQPQLVSQENFFVECDWHPVQERLVYEAVTEEGYQIRQLDLTGEESVLTDGQGGEFRDRNPEYSPNGETVVFERRHRQFPVAQLWSVDPATGLEKKLFYASSDVQSPVFTPDGESLIFASNHQGNDFDLYRMNLRDLEVTPLTDLPGDEHSPAVSPDGTALAFVHTDPQRNKELKIVELSQANPESR